MFGRCGLAGSRSVITRSPAQKSATEATYVPVSNRAGSRSGPGSRSAINAYLVYNQ